MEPVVPHAELLSARGWDELVVLLVIRKTTIREMYAYTNNKITAISPSR